MNNAVIQYKDVYVGGFSLKTQKVYYTKNPAKARKFTPCSAHKFIAMYANKGYGFETEHITMHHFRRGEPNIFVVEGVTNEKIKEC